MKIVVFSLLRIGDIFMAAPVVRGLKMQYPESEVTLVLNSQFSSVKRILPGVDHVIGFDRSLLQKGLGESERSVFESYDRLSAFITDLNSTHYDLALNLTHNRLSAWLFSLVNAEDKKGLTIDREGRVEFGSPWFRYLNELSELSNLKPFHFTDIFLYGSGLQPEHRHFELQESELGRNEARPFLDKRKQRVVLQTLTSDKKKSWHLDGFQKTISLLHQLSPNIDFIALAAPNEESVLRPWIENCRSGGLPVQLAVLSLDGVLSLLKNANLLITGDTSIKHLACATECKILEISIGSSDYLKTGAYSNNAIILQPRLSCAPCPHRTPCSRSHHACAMQLSPELVAMTAHKILNHSYDELRTLAYEFADETEMIRVALSAEGDWCPIRLGETLNVEVLETWISRTSTKLFLNRDDLMHVGTFGSETQKLKVTLRDLFPEEPSRRWLELLPEIDKYGMLIEREILGLESSFNFILKKVRDRDRRPAVIERALHTRRNLEQLHGATEYLQILKKIETLDRSHEFAFLRQVQDIIHETKRRIEIQNKVTRSLKNQMAEVI